MHIQARLELNAGTVAFAIARGFQGVITIKIVAIAICFAGLSYVNQEFEVKIKKRNINKSYCR